MQCPHCGQPILPGPPAKGTTTWQEKAKDQGGTLGCGTLIIIAIIVAIFSDGGADESDVRRVEKQVESLEDKVDRLNDDILSELARKLDAFGERLEARTANANRNELSEEATDVKVGD